MAGANYKLHARPLALWRLLGIEPRTDARPNSAAPSRRIPCLIESFLTDDPPLEQVVGRTARPGCADRASTVGRYTWSAGLFRTLASDDILPITEDNSRVFFVKPAIPCVRASNCPRHTRRASGV